MAACSGPSGTSLVSFYFESSNFFLLYDFAFFYDNRINGKKGRAEEYTIS